MSPRRELVFPTHLWRQAQAALFDRAGVEGFAFGLARPCPRPDGRVYQVETLIAPEAAGYLARTATGCGWLAVHSRACGGNPAACTALSSKGWPWARSHWCNAASCRSSSALNVARPGGWECRCRGTHPCGAAAAAA